MNDPKFTIAVYDGSVGADIVSEVVALYGNIYAEPPYFESEEDVHSFANDLARRTSEDSFRLVVARQGPNLLGFALGHQLASTTRWWEGAISPIPSDITIERPGRTFAIIELAVIKANRRRGIGRRLHEHLVAGLQEERTTLLVRPDVEPARLSYRSWGYRHVGQIRPFAEAPIYDVMTTTL